MIQINLLDQAPVRGRKSRPGKPIATGGNGGNLLVGLVVMVMLALDGGVGYSLFQKVHQAGEGNRVLRDEIKQVETKITGLYGQSDAVRNFQDVITNQKEVLRTLDPPDRVLWCEKLNMLASLVPAGVFLSEIDIDEKVEMVETEQSIKARDKWENTPKTKRVGEKPEAVNRPVIHYEMQITGLATGRDNVEQFDNVMGFHRAMTTYVDAAIQGDSNRFMSGFVNNIEFGMLEATVYEGVPVNKFVFKLRTLDQGGEAAAPPGNTSIAKADESKELASAQ